MKYTCTLERFLGDVQDHRMTIISEDGVNRHIRFSRKESCMTPREPDERGF